jgi:hypothetical protein
MCFANLKDAKTASVSFNQDRLRIVSDWEYLLQSESSIVPHVAHLNKKTALLYLLGYQPGINGTGPVYTIGDQLVPPLLQAARNSRSVPQHVHTSTILAVIRQKGVTCLDFSKISVPDEFIKAVLQKQEPLYKRLTCIAPWCPSYQKSGSLERTGTTKIATQNRNLKYYLICSDCLSEYAIESCTNSIVERGYFISVGWFQIRDYLIRGVAIKQIARTLGLPEDKVLRCAMFLAANHLLPEETLNHYKPKTLSATTPEELIHAIDAGYNIRNYVKERCLPYRELLYYWFLPNVRRSWLNKQVEAPHKKKDLSAKIENVKIALSQLLSDNQPITIARVSSLVGANHETLRQWGVLPQVKKFKEFQKEKLSRELICKVELLFQKQGNEILENISCDAVYRYLGISRKVMSRNYPAISESINRKIRKLKSN